MFAVPEVDDDITASDSKLETSPSQTTTEKEEKSPDIQSSSTSRQHQSRLTQFHRNTIHVCDQIVDRVVPHQQHHSAPPTHHQQAKTGLDAINENGEYLSTNDQQQDSVNQPRFPRSSTVPYPAYATIRKAGGNYLYHTDNPTLVQGTVSPEQLNYYYNIRQPFSLLQTNFQPISPHHQQYGARPVDILKPTFLIVPRADEQRLAAQISASNSPTPTKTKPMMKKKDMKISDQSPRTVRSVEVQTNNDSPTKTTLDTTYQHPSILPTPNPSPYVHFVNISYPTQSPETSIIQNEFHDYHQPSSSIRSMPNIALHQVSPYHLYGSPNLRQYHLTQQPNDESQQQQQVETGTESTGPQMTKPTTSGIRHEIGETDESSVTSLDFAHTDFVDMPGSWRYQSIPIRTVPRRHRAPLPQSFIEPQQYVSDSEQVLHSSSYRQQQLFGSIPTINRPFDSIRSQNPIQFPPSIRLNDKDIFKIASFYKSMGTLVYVGRSIATLYTSDFDAMANLKDWKKLYTGVPIWLFNTGMNPKRSRCIRLIISELGSSFTLWDTIVNGASDVRLPKPRHITLKSLETGTILALKFDETNATDEFHQYFVKLSCDPRNADLFDVYNAKRRRPVFVLRKRKIKKSAISKPSHFNHITKVDEHDRDSLYTFSVLVDDGAIVSS